LAELANAGSDDLLTNGRELGAGSENRLLAESEAIERARAKRGR
jgi:hypothetical protein